MHFMKGLFITVLTSALVATSFAQAPDFGGNAQKEAIKKLSFMVGEWSGGGWADIGGQHRPFKGTETILMKCEGAILSLEGNHYSEVGTRRIPVHSAFGWVRFDDRDKTYHMRSHLANGLESEFAFKALPNGYTWSQKHPTWGDVVYTAVFEGDKWTEYGEAEKDGKKVRMYEMSLTRTAAK